MMETMHHSDLPAVDYVLDNVEDRKQTEEEHLSNFLVIDLGQEAQ